MPVACPRPVPWCRWPCRDRFKQACRLFGVTRWTLTGQKPSFLARECPLMTVRHYSEFAGIVQGCVDESSLPIPARSTDQESISYLARQAGTRAAARAPRLQCACPMPRRAGGERAEAGAVALAAAATVLRRAVLVRPVPRAELRVGTNTSVHAPRHVARLLSCSVTAVVFAESSFHTSVQLAAV